MHMCVFDTCTIIICRFVHIFQSLGCRLWTSVLLNERMQRFDTIFLILCTGVLRHFIMIIYQHISVCLQSHRTVSTEKKRINSSQRAYFYVYFISIHTSEGNDKCWNKFRTFAYV